MSRRIAWVAVAALVAVLLVEAWVIWFREPAGPTAARPVTISQVRAAGAVDDAAASVADILTTSYAKYDAEAAGAEKLMTRSFAKKYAQTSDEIKAAFLKSKTSVNVHVAWAGVYRAGQDRVQALLFLDQVVTRQGGDSRTVPFRALVTVVPSKGKWLVADIDTR